MLHSMLTSLLRLQRLLAAPVEPQPDHLCVHLHCGCAVLGPPGPPPQLCPHRLLGLLVARHLPSLPLPWQNLVLQ